MTNNTTDIIMQILGLKDFNKNKRDFWIFF